MEVFCPHSRVMADPQDLLNGEYLYVESEPINEVMIALYGISPENMIQGDIQLENLPATEEIEQVYDDLIGPLLDPDANDAFTLSDIRGLIVNLVLYDASLDDSLYGQDLPATYQPRRLLELISYDGLDDVVVNGHPIFHWASERLFPYFLDNLGEEFIRSEFDDAVGPHGNTYLHSYLESSFRIRNPAFVARLLDLGFSLSALNDDGDTPLHLMVYQSRDFKDLESDAPFYALSKEEHKAMRNDLVRRGNALALRRYDFRMKRYNRYYQTLILLFHHHPNIDIENNQGVTVSEIIYGADPSYPHHDLQLAIGRPGAVERGRKQKLTEALRRLPRNITNRIRNSQGANLERARAVIKQRQMNNTRRKKEMVHRQLLNRASSEHSGGRRTYRGDTSFPHTPLHSRRKQRAKKQHTRR
jgi:hypothetical protein